MTSSPIVPLRTSSPWVPLIIGIQVPARGDEIGPRIPPNGREMLQAGQPRRGVRRIYASQAGLNVPRARYSTDAGIRALSARATADANG